MKGLQEIKAAIDQYVSSTNKPALEVIETLNKHYFNKAVTAEIKPVTGSLPDSTALVVPLAPPCAKLPANCEPVSPATAPPTCPPT